MVPLPLILFIIPLPPVPEWCDCRRCSTPFPYLLFLNGAVAVDVVHPEGESEFFLFGVDEGGAGVGLLGLARRQRTEDRQSPDELAEVNPLFTIVCKGWELGEEAQMDSVSILLFCFINIFYLCAH